MYTLRKPITYFGSLNQDDIIGEIKDIFDITSVSTGCTIERIHKFIVKRHEDELAVIIGPPFEISSSEGDYFHAQLDKLSNNELPDFNVSGGGFISLTVKNEYRKIQYLLKFYGKSGDYGKYDLGTLALANKIRDCIPHNCTVSFVWEDLGT